MHQKPAKVWGKKTPEFYADLRQQQVLVAMTTGKVFKGTLISVDVYEILMRQESGLELLLHKGHGVYVHRAR